MIVSVPTKPSRHFPSTSNMQEKKYNPSYVEYEEYMESKISKALKHVEGVGENEVIITLKSPKPDQKNFFVEEQKQASEVEGVLVIMDGGNQALISKNTIEAIEALFGIDAHKIKIMKRTAVK